jgi:hypothetical protein
MKSPEHHSSEPKPVRLLVVINDVDVDVVVVFIVVDNIAFDIVIIITILTIIIISKIKYIVIECHSIIVNVIIYIKGIIFINNIIITCCREFRHENDDADQENEG